MIKRLKNNLFKAKALKIKPWGRVKNFLRLQI